MLILLMLMPLAVTPGVHSEYCFGNNIDHVMLQVSQDCLMMDVVVDVNWTGEDEPALLED